MRGPNAVHVVAALSKGLHDRILAAPAQQIRPGIVVRKLLLGEDWISVRDIFCQDCGSKDRKRLDYMVQNCFWPPRCEGILCLECLAKRLKMSITVEMLTKAPINSPHFFDARLSEDGIVAEFKG